MFNIGISKKAIFVEKNDCSLIECHMNLVKYPWWQIAAWDEQITLQDIFEIMCGYEKLWTQIISNSYIPDYIEEFRSMQPVNNTFFSHLELRWYVDFEPMDYLTEETGPFLNFTCGLDAVSNSTDELPSEKYGIDFEELSDLLLLPIHLNTEFAIYAPDTIETPIVSGKKRFTIYVLIWGIMWSLTWDGSPEDKRKIKAEIFKDVDMG